MNLSSDSWLLKGGLLLFLLFGMALFVRFVVFYLLCLSFIYIYRHQIKYLMWWFFQRLVSLAIKTPSRGMVAECLKDLSVCTL